MITGDGDDCVTLAAYTAAIKCHLEIVGRLLCDVRVANNGDSDLQRI